jgi:cytochrome bd ubiquinol oxidase subunit I
MDFDVALLARLQFALTIMFHYLFPPLSIGLGVLLVFMEGMYLKTGNRQYEAMAKFWTRIFAVNFAVGVATGIVMEFEFGTNWATYSRFVGDVFGSALAAEGIFAFFLESGFLAVLVFGWDRVSPRMHFFSTVMVSLGSMFSAIWIVVANSWQQTPAGFRIVGEGLMARAEITDFWAMVFNPSSIHRLGHVLLGAFILGAFFAMSISAYYILRGRHLDFSKKTFTMALAFAAVSSLAIFVSGHFQAKSVARTQPAKLAAFEGHFVTGNEGSPMYLWGIPDEAEQRVKWGLKIPGLLSFMVHDVFNVPVPGLDQFSPRDRPPVAIPFQTYHLMIFLGMALGGLTLYGLFLLPGGGIFEKRWLLWTFVFAVAGPFIANQAGWVAAEVGRQPWIVYGLLRTSDAVSKAVSAGQIFGSIVMFGVIYLLLFAVWLVVLNDKIQHGPDEGRP